MRSIAASSRLEAVWAQRIVSAWESGSQMRSAAELLFTPRERDVIDAMTLTMACRGPDASGVWVQRHAALGHRRLAVIDLPGGTQPMSVSTPNGDVVMVYSGEAYNFAELRDECFIMFADEPDDRAGFDIQFLNEAFGRRFKSLLPGHRGVCPKRE